MENWVDKLAGIPTIGKEKSRVGHRLTNDR